VNVTLRGLIAGASLAFGCWSNTATAAPDSTLFTTYTVDESLQHAHYSVCGSTKETGGCYASGLLGSYGQIGAMLEGDPVISGNTVTRQIYVLDVANGPSRDAVALFVYTKTDVVTETFDHVTVKPDRKFNLPLVGGKAVTTFMAGNESFIFVGTNESEQAVMMNKHDLRDIETLGAGSPAAPVAAINADNYGYVSVEFAEPNASVYVFGPTGANVSEGGGQYFVLNDLNGVVPQRIAP
jgi:hypothetical protein